MSATKHTPGPWEFKTTWCDHVMSGDGAICVPTDYNSKGESRPIIERRANARLIAAAPELLQELKNLRRAYVNLLETGRDRILSLGGQCDDVPTMEASDPNLRDASAAIAKATGAAS